MSLKKARIWKSKDPLFVRTEIIGHSPFEFTFVTSALFCQGAHRLRVPFLYFDTWSLNYLASTWCTRQEYHMIGWTIKIRELCRPYPTFYPLLDICTNNIVIIIVSSTLIAYCTYEKMISSLFVKRWKESLPSYYIKDHDSMPHVSK